MTAVPDLRPNMYLPPIVARAECEAMIRRIRVMQRACRIMGDQHGAECAEERLDIALTVWKRLDALTRVDTREA